MKQDFGETELDNSNRACEPHYNGPRLARVPEKKIGIQSFVYFFGILILLPIIFFAVDRDSNKKREHYRENGFDVTATIVSARKRSQVIVIYVDKDGRIVRAGTYNPPSLVIGEQYVGKVVDDKPNLVYRERPSSMRAMRSFYRFYGVFYLLNLIALFFVLRGIRAKRKLVKKGEVTEAEIINCDRHGDELLVDIRLYDPNGVEYTATCSAPGDMDFFAKTCLVRYIVKSENTIDCEIIYYPYT